MIISMPKDENEAQHLVHTAMNYDDGPFAVRYPRGNGAGIAPRVHEDDVPADGVGEYVEQLGGRGIAATGAVLRGHDPVTAIVDHAVRTRASMVVATALADPGQPTHWFHTARRLIRFVPCPVLVVPADG